MSTEGHSERIQRADLFLHFVAIQRHNIVEFSDFSNSLMKVLQIFCCSGYSSHTELKLYDCKLLWQKLCYGPTVL